MYRDLGQPPVAWNLIALTNAAIGLGHYSAARVTSKEILETSRIWGHLAEKGVALTLLGKVCFVEGDLTKARSCLLEGASILVELQRVNQAVPLAILSYVFRALGDSKSAHNYLASALHSCMKLRYTYSIMCCLPAAALIAADDGRTERAVELYGVAQQFGNIRNSRWFEDVAGRELNSMRASLPPEVVKAAEARGRELDMWQTAEDLLHELNKHAGS